MREDAPITYQWGRGVGSQYADSLQYACIASRPRADAQKETPGTSRTHLPTHRHTYSGHPSPPPPPATPTPLGQAAPVDVRGISRSPRPPRLRLLTVTELLDPNPTDDFSTVPWPTAFPPKSEPTAPPWRQRAQNSSLGRTKKHAQRWKLDVPILIRTRTRTRAPIQLN